MPWTETLSLLGALQGVLLAALLLTRPRNRRANGILTLFVLLFSISLTEGFYERTLPLYAVEVLGGLVFLYGPLLFFYVKTVLGEPSQPKGMVVHCLPFGFYQTALMLSYGFQQPGSELVEFIVSNAYFVHLLGYSHASWRRVRRETRQEAPANPVMLWWLKALLALLTGVYLSAFVATYLLAFGIQGSDALISIIQIGCVVLVYALSYWALVQPDLSPQQAELVRYKNSPLTESAKEIYLAHLLAFTEQHRPYLRPDLTLDQFAKEVGLNRFYVSQVINERLGKNFSEFINTHRIAEAKRLLTDPRKAHYSILGVAYEAGFNSKTAFNTAFKKLTGQRPTDYRKFPPESVPHEQSER